jgi:hypothetical protein
VLTMPERCKENWPGSGPAMACEVYVSAPPASSMTVTAGRRAQEKVPGVRSREVMLDPGASADTPVRNQGPGRSLPGPDAGHPLQGAGISHEEKNVVQLACN